MLMLPKKDCSTKIGQYYEHARRALAAAQREISGGDARSAMASFREASEHVGAARAMARECDVRHPQGPDVEAELGGVLRRLEGACPTRPAARALQGARRGRRGR